MNAIADFEQLKLLSEKHCHLRDAIPYHWSLWFLVSPCYLQNAMPCQWSSSHLECYGFERVFFYSQVFFTLHSPAGFKDSLGSRQFNLKISRASCSSSKHSPGLTICLNYSNPQKSYAGRFYLRVLAGQPTENLPLTGFELFSQQASMLEALCFIRLATEPHSLR